MMIPLINPSRRRAGRPIKKSTKSFIDSYIVRRTTMKKKVSVKKTKKFSSAHPFLKAYIEARLKARTKKKNPSCKRKRTALRSVSQTTKESRMVYRLHRKRRASRKTRRNGYYSGRMAPRTGVHRPIRSSGAGHRPARRGEWQVLSTRRR